jgi:DMSO/TMAO reductase YedYZ molybdopterin-dependent catalytic subunit
MTVTPERDPKYQASNPSGAGDFDSDVIVSPDVRRALRVPPGQSRTRKWPVLHATTVPHVSLETWRLEIGGLVDRPLSYTWDEFRRLPRVRVLSDFHCVTRWSRLGNLWEGVSVKSLLQLAGIRPEAKFVIASGYDGDWTTNMPLDEFSVDDALFADTHDGEPISADHGGPCRLIVPRLYAWKSAKWVRAIELTRDDRPGYWERLGYHHHGDPWTEERTEW